jgi:nitrite reductase/ring-hydroxylating ferredoxin subunit/Fe-S cluster biogenesis protein NfuA
MDLDAALSELEQLVATLERDGDERALLLLQLVDAIHRPGIERLAAGDADHPLARGLLAMYGLAEPDLAIEDALDEVRPYIESHGGGVELLGVDAGVVRVRLHGACVGCAGSAMTLRRGVEDALRRHYPGFRELVADEAPAPAGNELPMVHARRPVFAMVASLHELAEGDLRGVEADGSAVVLARVSGEVYALRDGCAVDGLPLAGGRLTADGVLVCPWHNCAYDVRSGRRVDDEEGRVAVVPVAVRGDEVAIAVGAA